MKYIPMDELRFAAKFGFLSRRLWEKHFSKRSRTRNIRVWQSFIDEGYFKRHHDLRYKDVLHLGKLGKKTLERNGFEYVSPANAFQIHHDEIVAEIALQLIKSDLITRYLTEAQAKKQLTDWKRQFRYGEKIKFPDILFYRTDGASIALEVEITRKSTERYSQIVKSYANQTWTSRILYITGQPAIFDRIIDAMQKHNFPTWEKSVAFSFADGWITDPMTRKLYLAKERTATFEEWLKEGMVQKPAAA